MSTEIEAELNAAVTDMVIRRLLPKEPCRVRQNVRRWYRIDRRQVGHSRERSRALAAMYLLSRPLLSRPPDD